MAVEVLDRTGLAEMFDAERTDPVPANAAEPGGGRRMAVDHANDAAMARQRRQQHLDMTFRKIVPLATRPLGR
jgi:hypothetical protein